MTFLLTELEFCGIVFGIFVLAFGGGFWAGKIYGEARGQWKEFSKRKCNEN